MRNILRLLFLTAFVAIGSLAAVLGVDYGQQNIKAIVVSPQAPLELVLTPEAKRKEISGLSIKRLPGYGKDDPNGIERIYGSAVGSLATRFPQNTLLHLKPLLGKSLEDETTVTLYSKQHPGLEMVSTNRSTIAFLVDNVEYPLEELVAMNVQEIANRANSLLKDRDARAEDFVNKMSFTIPDFFDQHQRKALLDASSITTGIEETYLVSEGMSVAVNFVLKQRQFPPGEQQHYIVYDMGSGSIKASMFSILQPEDTTQPVTIEFEGYGYNPHLGGAKFTMDIGNLIENKFLETHPAIRTDELHANPKALAKINQAAEKAKLILSANSEASINIESLINDIDFRTSITRQEFEEFIADSLLDIVKPINDAVTKQFGGYRTNLPEINGVILAGGSSRVPIVQDQLIKLVSEEKVLRNVNADESAVNGVVMRGIKLSNSFKTKPINVVDRSVNTYSFKLSNESELYDVFTRGSAYPNKTSILTNTTDSIPNNFTIDLFENGKLFETITVNSGAVKNSYSSDKCSSGVAYNITFDLSSDRLFSIQEVNCVCQSENDIGNSKQIKNKGSRLAFTSEDVEIKRLSPSERSRLHEHIKLLDKQDKERFQFQENLNVLESNLYDARNLLMDDEVMQNGPKSQVEELSEMVKVYLDWLEDASFDTDPEDIVSRIREIGILKKKIELYMDSAKEPLNSQQFKGMLEEGHKLLQAIETHKNTVEEFLSQFETEFADTIDNVREEFKKIKQPAYVSKALSTWEETLTSFKNSISEIEKFLAKNLFGEDLREHLFEIKLQFDMYRTKLEEKLRLIKSGDESRLNEIKKLHLRNFRLQKRKEEKLKRKLEQEKSRNNNETESTVINSADDKTTIVNDKTTESNPSSEEDILHDEL
ncbi:BAG_1a_G0032130.mRNA.1.CDS.1 [Saccharomyces cerevisiae]|nr:SX2_G0004090.mRNA.1.CDS.1 [Saccharomyces cerevisiae]CAI4567425.1 BAG_1a_G0032130.mRNA.1.CDS.1 [Saccharomyces cerevisiae]CAI7180827.1 BAG_1a_G0032130.mRNA.1.CDS.1 [Saccharomyces cerevisiae]